MATHRTTLTQPERDRLSKLATQNSDVATAEKFGLHRATIDRLIAGRPSNFSTVALARMVMRSDLEPHPMTAGDPATTTGRERQP